MISASSEPAASSSLPFNAAMERLRKLCPSAVGGTPVTDVETSLHRGDHVRAMAIACLASLASGTALGHASVTMPSIEREYWYSLERSPPQNRWVADILLVGAAAGALLSGLLLRLVGHRRTLMLSAVGQFGAWISLFVSNHVAMLLVGRALCGFWLGVTTNCASLYVSDVAPPAKRSLFGGLTEQVAMNMGALSAYSLSGFKWEIQAILCAMAPLPVLAMHHHVIESPLWLRARGRGHDADTAVTQLYGMDPPPEFRMVSLCLMVNLVQNLSFIQLLLLRAVQIMEPLVSTLSAHEAAVLMVLLHVSWAALFATLTHVAGRRRLLGASAVLVAAVLVTLRPLEHLVFRQWTTEEVPTATRWDAVISVSLLALGHSVGLCHLPSLLTSELLPLNRWRFLGASCVWSFRWLVAFALVHGDHQVLRIDEYQGSTVAYSLTLVLITGAAVVYMPETDGRSLEDIDRYQ
ncbi:hypothetical protein V5799_024425 [Amblyomma americanum]|uniref:Major facilitator superfamily (MFS) profile domain-containing protein n=1 Tax=Amblyomma americanum TaxID=6943 RepID=A0AAQ4ECL8_AMBAM